MSGIAGAGMSGNSDSVAIPRFVLEDSPKLAKKLKEFEAAQAAAIAATQLVGSAEEILNLRVQVDRELADANATSAKARQEADEVKSVAIAEAARRVTEAELTAKDMRERAKKTLEEAESVMATADSVMSESGIATKAAVALGEQLKAKDQLLQQRAADLDTREQELKENTAKLANLGEHIRDVLG